MNRFMAFLLPGLLLGSACTTRSRPEPAEKTVPAAPPATPSEVRLTGAQRQTIGITVGSPAAAGVHTALRVNGTIDVAPENLYTISFPMGGYLKSSRLLPGTRVRKGQLLATLEDVQFIQLQQDYLMERSKLAYTRADFERQEELNRSKAASDKTFQQAKTDYERQKVLVRSLREKLLLVGINPDRLTEQTLSRSVNIYAPISGFVSRVNVNPGKYVSPTDVLFELTDPSRLHLSLQVFEKDARSLRVGQRVSCYTAAAPQRRLGATIHLISPSLNDARTVDVHCHFDAQYDDLIPGLFMTAEIEQNTAQVPSVPEEAVVRWQNSSYVFLEQAPNTFRLYPVATGRAAGGLVEITTPLPDSPIVTGNAYALLMTLKNSSEAD